MKTYAELLKDPRWQKKRLEIFQRDYFCCRICGSKDVTLNVHHQWYEKKTKPWDVDDDSLITLCENCHKFITDFKYKIFNYINHYFTDGFDLKYLWDGMLLLHNISRKDISINILKLLYEHECSMPNNAFVPFMPTPDDLIK